MVMKKNPIFFGTYKEIPYLCSAKMIKKEKL